MPTATIAQRAIRQSAAQNEIVTRPYSDDAADELLALCDGDAVNDMGHKVVREYWGTDDDGDDWRVHLVTERADW